MIVAGINSLTSWEGFDTFTPPWLSPDGFEGVLVVSLREKFHRNRRAKSIERKSPKRLVVVAGFFRVLQLSFERGRT